MGYDYYAKTRKIVMVPVEVFYHDATGVMFHFTPPTRDDVEKALNHKEPKQWFVVYDNDKPASTVGFPYLKSPDWCNNRFETLEAAQQYAKDWLGIWHGSLVENLRPNNPVDYSGYGDMLEIREETT